MISGLTSGLPKPAREFSASCLTTQKQKGEWKELFRLALARPLLSDLAQLHYLGFPKDSQAPGWDVAQTHPLLCHQCPLSFQHCQKAQKAGLELFPFPASPALFS